MEFWLINHRYDLKSVTLLINQQCYFKKCHASEKGARQMFLTLYMYI